MRLSDLIHTLVSDLAVRGDCELVQRDGENWTRTDDAKIYRTPFKSPIDGAAYVEFEGIKQ